MVIVQIILRNDRELFQRMSIIKDNGQFAKVCASRGFSYSRALGAETPVGMK